MRAALRCAALRCAALRCAALRRAALRCAALCCAVLCCAVLCCPVLCCAVPCCCLPRPSPSGAENHPRCELCARRAIFCREGRTWISGGQNNGRPWLAMFDSTTFQDLDIWECRAIGAINAINAIAWPAQVSPLSSSPPVPAPSCPPPPLVLLTAAPFPHA